MKDGTIQGGEVNDGVADGKVVSPNAVIDRNQDDCQFLSKCTFEETYGMVSSEYFLSLPCVVCSIQDFHFLKHRYADVITKVSNKVYNSIIHQQQEFKENL